MNFVCTKENFQQTSEELQSSELPLGVYKISHTINKTENYKNNSSWENTRKHPIQEKKHTYRSSTAQKIQRNLPKIYILFLEWEQQSIGQSDF